MLNLRILIAALFLALAAYTAVTISLEGINFVPGFIGDLVAMGWRGQINLDFMSYLTLTALWVAWRHEFSVSGLLLALVVLLGAWLAFAPYLLYATGKSRGDFVVLLLGENRATGQ